MPKELERTLDLSQSSTRVRAVATFKNADKVILEADRATDVLPKVVAQGNSLVWTFARATDRPNSTLVSHSLSSACRRSVMSRQMHW